MQQQFDINLNRMLSQANTIIGQGSNNVGGKCNNTILLAVSGGVDSMVMAYLFLHSSININIEIAHCNFKLRQEDSFNDERFVANWCNKNNIKFHTVEFDTIAYAKAHGLSIEMAARNLRFAWFNSLCKEHGFKYVAVAHNANDNAETLMLNLLRGTGIKGLCGMKQVSKQPVQGAENLVLRPLLNFTREQIENYATHNNIAYCTDYTNAETDYKRNKIRNLVFPIFQAINPSFISTFNANITRFAMADKVVEEFIKASLLNLEQQHNGYSQICINKLLQHPCWDYVLYGFLEKYGFNKCVLDNIVNIINLNIAECKEFNSSNYILTVCRGVIQVRNKLAFNQVNALKIDQDGIYKIGNRTFKFTTINNITDFSFKMPDGTIAINANKLYYPFYIRGWEKGDWIKPLGLNRGSKKISDLFTDLHYNLFQKQEALLLLKQAENKEVLALLCVRISNKVKLYKNSYNILLISEVL